MKIFGFDLDGVFFVSPIPFYGILKNLDLNPLIKRLKRIAFLKNKFYQSIRIDKEMVVLANQIKQARHKIMIISGHSLGCREEVFNCLKRGKIPFDALHLCPDGHSHKSFKLSKIRETCVDFYVEDRLSIVNFLDENLKGTCKIFHYKDPHSLLELTKTLLI